MSAPVATGASGGRSLARYLLLPRPGDLIKAWIFPAAFLLGALATGVDGRDVLRALVVWAALELLIYQARYQWNDIRGFAADQRHPQATERERLPGPAARGRRHKRASWAVLGGRLGAAALLALLLPLGLAIPLAALAGAVFAVAFLYEALRSAATGSSDRVPPAPGPSIVVLWLLVGGGYAIRAVAGLALAIDLASRPALLVTAILAAWSFGIAFVTSRWALEALPFASRREDGSLDWAVEAGQAREHSLALARWLPAVAPPQGNGGGDLAGWQALSRDVSLSAPWNLAAIVAAAAAAVAGQLLVGPAGLAEGLLVACGGGLLAAATLAQARHRPTVWAVASFGMVALLAGVGSGRPLLAALPWTIVVGAHVLFTAQSARTLRHPLRHVVDRALAATSPPSRGRAAFLRPSGR